jgi:hypothetical protein
MKSMKNKLSSMEDYVIGDIIEHCRKDCELSLVGRVVKLEDETVWCNLLKILKGNWDYDEFNFDTNFKDFNGHSTTKIDKEEKPEYFL